MTMNVLVWRLPLAGRTATYIALIFFSPSKAPFMTKKSLYFPWWLVSVGGLEGICTPSNINNSHVGTQVVENVYSGV